MVEKRYFPERRSAYQARRLSYVMADCDREKIVTVNMKLKEILFRHTDRPGVCSSSIDGLSLVRREAVDSSERCIEKPLVSVIVQGVKHSTVGTQEYRIRENQCLVSGVDMPSASYVVEPTPEKPFLSLFFYLDRQILTDLVMEMEPENRPHRMGGQGVSVADAEPESLESLLRLAELLDKPKQIAIRAPIICASCTTCFLSARRAAFCRDCTRRGRRTIR